MHRCYFYRLLPINLFPPPLHIKNPTLTALNLRFINRLKTPTNPHQSQGRSRSGKQLPTNPKPPTPTTTQPLNTFACTRRKRECTFDSIFRGSYTTARPKQPQRPINLPNQSSQRATFPANFDRCRTVSSACLSAKEPKEKPKPSEH